MGNNIAIWRIVLKKEEKQNENVSNQFYIQLLERQIIFNFQMQNQEYRQILQPIDPLDISFSEQKCIKTPDTRRTDSHLTPDSVLCPQFVIRDPKELFETNPPVSKFETYNEVHRQGVEIAGFELYEVMRTPLTTRKSRKRLAMGKTELKEDLQTKKLDLLINRINNRLKASSKVLSA